MNAQRNVISISGPQGSGKSQVAHAMFLALGWKLIDADDFHDKIAREKMRSGEGVDDEYRARWINQVFGAVLHEVRLGHNVILAWSGIRKDQRRKFVELVEQVAIENVTIKVRIAYLHVSEEELRRRIEYRDVEGKHFAPANLLPAQLAATEMPSDEEEYVVVIDGVWQKAPDEASSIESDAWKIGNRVWNAVQDLHPYGTV